MYGWAYFKPREYFFQVVKQKQINFTLLYRTK